MKKNNKIERSDVFQKYFPKAVGLTVLALSAALLISPLSALADQEDEPISLKDSPMYQEHPNRIPAYYLMPEGYEDPRLTDPFSGLGIPSEEYLSEESAGTYAAKYDPRSQGKITGVKDQGQIGSCALFASAAIMESNLIRQGIATSSLDLSEAHLYYLVHKEEMSTINTAAAAEETGSHFFNVEQKFKEGFGPIYESRAPYSDMLAKYQNLSTYSLPDSLVNDRDFDFVKSYYLSLDSNSERINSAKEMITKYGGLYASVCMYDNGGSTEGVKWASTSTGDANSYVNTNYKTNHGVEIVGWDDNYAASNFIHSCPGNGAWLVKNSWGTGSYKGNGGYIGSGYFWLSYYDNSVDNGYVYAVEMARKNTVVKSFSAQQSEVKVYKGKQKDISVSYQPAGATIGTEFTASGNYNCTVDKLTHNTFRITGKNETSGYNLTITNGMGQTTIPIIVSSPKLSCDGILDADQKKVTSDKLIFGEPYSLPAAIDYDPAFCTDAHSVLYTSSDPSVIEVTSDGRLLTKDFGSCKITVANSDPDIVLERSFNVQVVSTGYSVETDGIRYKGCKVPGELSCSVKVITKEGVDVTDRAELSGGRHGQLKDGVFTYPGGDTDSKTVTQGIKVSGIGVYDLGVIPIQIEVEEHDIKHRVLQKCSEGQNGIIESYCAKCGTVLEKNEYSMNGYLSAYMNWIDGSEKVCVNTYINLTGEYSVLGDWHDLTEGTDYTLGRENGFYVVCFTEKCPLFAGKYTTWIQAPEDPANDPSNNPSGYDGSQYSNEGGYSDPSAYNTQSVTQSSSQRAATPGKVRSVSVKSKKKGKIKVKWNRAANADRYIVRYSTSKDFSHAKRYYTSRRSISLGGLKSGVKYYVSVKALNSTRLGKNASWSKAKKVVIK